MALNYMGVRISYRRLLKLLRAKEFGAPAFNIRLLDQLGLIVVYKQGTLEELHEHLMSSRPCIAFVNTRDLPYWSEETLHAVIVVGMDERFIYLNDPALATGSVEVSHGDFDLAWLDRNNFYAALMRRI